VATNQMRREAAKRKLERQQERRVQQAQRRQRVAVITSVAVVAVVVVGIVLFATLSGGEDATPEAAAPADTLGECSFVPADAASKPAPVPTITSAPTTGTAAVTLQTDQGAVPLTLDRTQGPCAVENFLSLTAAGYYDGTPCHRLTAGGSLSVLQCGDPTGTGSGGPGYTVNDEPPTTLAADPSGNGVTYPRGTVAMAKTAAPDSAGSQFFLVYADSVLPPDYTVFGTIGDEGLATLDAIAAGGTDDANGPGDGAPRTPTTIRTATAS
jgi:peptidyl-prolyl cis-trans isomerase B (cyclophilin B)